MAEADATTNAPAAQDTGTTDSSTTTHATGTEQAGTGSLFDWKGAYLGPEMQRDSFFDQFKDVGALAKTAKSQAEMIGRGIYLPRDTDAPEKQAEQWRTIHTKLGCPTDATGYLMPDDVQLPDGYEFQADFLSGLKAMAWEEGYTQKQFSAAVHRAAQSIRDGKNLQESQRAQSEINSRITLGKHFGAQATEMQQKAIALWDLAGDGAFGGGDGIKGREVVESATLPDGSPLLNHPLAVTLFAALLDRVGEGELYHTEYHASADPMAAMQARNQELATKNNAGTLTSAEKQEWDRLAVQILNARERAQSQGRRVA